MATARIGFTSALCVVVVLIQCLSVEGNDDESAMFMQRLRVSSGIPPAQTLTTGATCLGMTGDYTWDGDKVDSVNIIVQGTTFNGYLSNNSESDTLVLVVSGSVNPDCFGRGVFTPRFASVDAGEALEFKYANNTIAWSNHVNWYKTVAPTASPTSMPTMAPHKAYIESAQLVTLLSMQTEQYLFFGIDTHSWTEDNPWCSGTIKEVMPFWQIIKKSGSGVLMPGDLVYIGWQEEPLYLSTGEKEKDRVHGSAATGRWQTWTIGCFDCLDDGANGIPTGSAIYLTSQQTSTQLVCLGTRPSPKDCNVDDETCSSDMNQCVAQTFYIHAVRSADI